MSATIACHPLAGPATMRTQKSSETLGQFASHYAAVGLQTRKLGEPRGSVAAFTSRRAAGVAHGPAVNSQAGDEALAKLASHFWFRLSNSAAERNKLEMHHGSLNLVSSFPKSLNVSDRRHFGTAWPS